MKSRIRVVRLNPLINLSLACRLYEDSPCVAACPRDALTQSEETGIIQVDEDRCNGCGWCIEACDYGAVTLHPENKIVFICDLCDGDPECVKWCPEEALDFVTADILAQKARITAVKKLFQEALKTIPR
jgi:Fe-S-cluster-containing dehydrogenase component